MAYQKLPGIYRGKNSSPVKAVDKELVEGAYTGPGKPEKAKSDMSSDQEIWDRLREKDEAIDSAAEVKDDDGNVIAKAGTWKAYKLNKKAGKDDDKEESREKNVTGNIGENKETNNDTDNTKLD